MTAAAIAMGLAAIEAEVAHWYASVGADAGRQRHGGWAVILGGVAIGLVAIHLFERWVLG